MVKTIDKVLLGLFVITLIVVSTFFVSGGSIKSFFNEEDAKEVALKLIQGVVTEVDTENENSNIVYEVDVLSNGIEKEVTINKDGEVLFVNNEENDNPITGTTLIKASKVALDYIGEGKVTDTEIYDEEGYYEIEITLSNGNEVDVHLDETFNVLSVER
jgi:uncharacterized membrane protein YkoI